MLSWVRAISFLRLFKSTRVFITLLISVTNDIVPFLIVLFVSFLGFSIAYLALLNLEDGEDIEHDIIYAVKYNYFLMY